MSLILKDFRDRAAWWQVRVPKLGVDAVADGGTRRRRVGADRAISVRTNLNHIPAGQSSGFREDGAHGPQPVDLHRRFDGYASDWETDSCIPSWAGSRPAGRPVCIQAQSMSVPI